MSNASIIWRSDDKEVIASLQKMEKEVEKLREENKKLKDVGKDATTSAKTGAESASSGIGKWNGSLTQLASSYLGVNALISAGNQLLQDQIELENKSADKQRSVADEQIKFLRNLGLVSKEERTARLAQAKEIADTTGVTEASNYPSLNVAMSAKGPLSPEQSMEFARVAAMVVPEDAGERASFTGGLLDTVSLTKSPDPLANLGFLAAMQQQARVTTLAQASQNLVPAAISVANLGGSPEEAAAGVATFTSGMKDPTGALSRTAFISLAQQVSGVTKGGFAEDIKFLQENKGAREAFLANATFEKAADSFSRDFVTPGTEMAKLYEKNKKGYPSAEGRVAAADEFIQGIREPELQKRAAFSRRTEQQEEKAQLENLPLGDFSRYNERIRKVSDAAGIPGWFSALGYGVSRLNYAFGNGPEESAAQRIGLSIPTIQQGQKDAERFGRTEEAAWYQKQHQALMQVVDELREIKRNQNSKGVVVNAHSE